MSTFLLDANLSSKTRVFLVQTFGFDVEDLLTRNQGLLPDEAIVVLAKQERRIIITFDKGFDERYFRQERGALGIIVLRLTDQHRDTVHAVLRRFFDEQAQDIDLDFSLVTIEDNRIRVTTAR